mgnify:CR=1 FL=1
MKITNEIIRNSFLCNYKVKELWSSEIPKKGILKTIAQIEKSITFQFIIHNGIKPKNLRLSSTSEQIESNLLGFYKITYRDESLNLNYPLVEFKHKDRNTIVYFFSGNDVINKEYINYCKLLVSFLAEKLNIHKISSVLVYDYDMKTKSFNLSYDGRNILIEDRITKIIGDENLHPSRIKHCYLCELNEYCKEKLIEQNHLKLLRRISDKEVAKLNSKGISTINQVAYTFKPKKRNKRTNSRGRYLYELKAMSLRDNITHVLNKRSIPKVKNELFVDFEGNLKYSIYLIGVVHRKDSNVSAHYFWSNTANEKKIFSDFFKFIFDLQEGYCLFHYGSYETKAILKANKLHSIIENEKLTELINNSCNVLDYFYSDVFPPTYSNGLKEIANYLGFNWSRKIANGFQVTFWRKSWIVKQKTKTKRKIITYNIEDCFALVTIIDWLIKINAGNENFENVIVDTKRHLRSRSSLKYGRPGFLNEDYQEVNKLAYFNYQREKIILRDNNFKKSYAPKSLVPKKTNIVNSHNYPSRPINCERCSSSKINIHQNQPRNITDLKIGLTGIKKNYILFHGKRFRCEECKYVFTPKEYKHIPKYGFYLKAWVINQIVSYRTSFGNLKRMLLEYYQINMTVTSFSNARSEFSNMYTSLLKEFKSDLITGNLIQGDETKINLRSESGYIWVLTNLNTVIYIYQPNREGNFLVSYLEDFTGVVVSDFYAVYNSIGASQQKCLIHLIRDINDDFFKDQLNDDLRFISESFGALLKVIVFTIDKYGLKNRYLKKHKKDVNRFFKILKRRICSTEIGKKWINRFIRNENSLFTFLDHNGVPWNNNNAEHAIKSIAIHRREINGFYSRKGIDELLVLLSISETCKYRGISFWEFLKSKKRTFKEVTA